VLRVIGIDPGTISIDLCGREDGRVFLDRSLPTAGAVADPSILVALLQAHVPLDHRDVISPDVARARLGIVS
jgi:predicted butyrate kinase (DUF1464 family)